MTMPEEVERALFEAKALLLDRHGADPNVVGVGVGFRQRDGRTVDDEPVVTVLVEKKRPSALVAAHRRVPASVEANGHDCKVDVVEAGPFTHLYEIGSTDEASVVDEGVEPVSVTAVHPITGRVRPPVQGVSTGNGRDPGGGTLGCFVYDPADQTFGLLSASHVLARDNQGVLGQDPVLQPSVFDGGAATDRIATLKRFTRLAPDTDVDAAVAKLTDQQGYRLTFASDGSGRTMPPISDDHPAIGIVVAGDAYGNCFLTRMDRTVAALGVVPAVLSYAPGGGDGVAAPVYGRSIEKVGRTSGYSSSKIQSIGMNVKVNTQGPLGTIWYHDLIYTTFFALPGDSGAVACHGGTGKVLVRSTLDVPCQVLSPVGNYYDLPLANDGQLADAARDKFLTMSTTGRLLITTTYVNSQVLKSRLAGISGDGTERAYAQGFYDRYRNLFAQVLADPESSRTVTGDDHFQAHLILENLGKTLLTGPELAAGRVLLEVLHDAIGLNRKGLVPYMNSLAVYRKVYNALSAVPTIDLTGPVKVYPR